MKTLRLVSRILIGLVFIFSGFVKIIDPLGSTYKFTDYFNAFDMSFLTGLALPLAILLASLELIVGITMVLGYRMKFFSWILLLLAGFFTLLTLYSAIQNPVTDCGCFGDAVILSNWTTFYKNIILMIFVLIIFTGRNQYKQITLPGIEWLVIVVFTVSSFLLGVYCLQHLPLIDFRPFHVGADIPGEMVIPEDAPADVYDTKLYYKNIISGKVKEFTMENYPSDSLWEFVDSKSVLVSKGYEPPIHDFIINAPDGSDITDLILENKGYSILLISYNINKADTAGLKKAVGWYDASLTIDNLSFYAISASIDQDVRTLEKNLKLGYKFSSADEIMLKTMIRSNPGMMLIKDGIVLGKWGSRDIPSPGEVSSSLTHITEGFPLALGADLKLLQDPQPGMPGRVYESVLYYRNRINGSLATFSMDNIPDAQEWIFERSETILKADNTPLAGFAVKTQEGTDISQQIINDPGNQMLFICGEPHTIAPDLLDRVNRLSMMSASLGTDAPLFYGLTAYNSQQVLAFTDAYITPVLFCSTPETFISRVTGGASVLIWLKDGIVAGRWENEQIPEPDALAAILSKPVNPLEIEPNILSFLFSSSSHLMEKYLVYIFIFGFLVLLLIIGRFFEDPFRSKE